MKKHFLFISGLILSFAACERINSDNYFDPVLKIGNNIVFSYNDFELYDPSSHILYFKSNHPEFVDYRQSPFTFYADTIKIYQGSFWPSYLSSLPTDPYISSFPFFYPNYALKIDFVAMEQGKADPRNDDRLISAFKNHDLLHSGLSGEIKNLVKNGSQLTLTFSVTNRDKSDLLILDPEKMGSKLFHYFTNAPMLYNTTQKVVYYAITDYQVPSPSNSWSADWLSLLRSGETRQFTFNYTIDSPLSSGEYTISYEFPGLSHQVTKDQLYQDAKRIWLGDIQLTTKMTLH
jgi:hypothetical protein